MRKIAGFVNFLIQIIMFAMGVALIYFVGMGYPDKGKEFLNLLVYNMQTAIPLSMVLILLPILYLFCRIAGKERRTAKIYIENPDGKVSISDKAIIDFIGRICRNYEEVSNSVSKVIPSKKSKSAVVVSISMDIMGGINIPETVEKLQQNIKRQLNELLGLENIESVEININKIISTESEIDQKEGTLGEIQ